MRVLGFAFALALAGLVTATAACGGHQIYNWKAENALGYRVGPGDQLKVSVWKHEELSQLVTVRPDGIPAHARGGRRRRRAHRNEIGADIAKRSARFFQDNPPVSVQVAEVRSYKIYVVGEVQRSGEFTPNHQVTVLHGLALAGGFTRFASPDRIIIVRKDSHGERRIPFDYGAVVNDGDLQEDLALQTGDTVIVP